ncbi:MULTISPECIES: TetR/AcrR family transcriptional regulator [Pseudofrankia]|uniref:TetR/AcrR family transcriptional regulator n=1 Tax=Pseudofrankia TaxID=2994363 RepID=UPI000234CA5C|nr:MULTISPECIES: TetR/AcrR family transcriptional regulator [Pseudofrankia]OHV41527.1 hypothetical protein BCD49_00800 [Pseudofrankia sp. EUN1h]
MTPTRDPAAAAAAAGPKRQERGRRRAESILDAAELAISEVGYDAVTTNLIAARAGISPGSLYQYFANKQAIVEALALRYLEHLGAAGAGLLGPELVTLPTAELVERVVDPVVAFNLAHPAANTLLAGAGLSPELATATRSLHASICDQIEVLIGEIAPHLALGARHLAATVSFQIFAGVLPVIAAAAPGDRPAVTRELKAAITGYWSGLRVASNQPRR